jgi:hypothetical protein
VRSYDRVKQSIIIYEILVSHDDDDDDDNYTFWVVSPCGLHL